MMEIDAKTSVLEAEHLRQKALVALDMAALDKLFADDLTHIHSTGLTHNKGELLGHIERRRTFIAIERGPLDIRIEGNLAIMTGRIINHMRAPGGEGEVVLEGVVTQVLRKTADGWKFIHFQFTPNRES